MIGSDNIKRGPDKEWSPRGVVHHATFRCWGCDKPRSTTGAKLVGPLRLRHCAECVLRNVRANRPSGAAQEQP